MGFWKSLGANVGTLPAHRSVKWEFSERKEGCFLASSSVARVSCQCSTALEGPVVVPTKVPGRPLQGSSLVFSGFEHRCQYPWPGSTAGHHLRLSSALVFSASLLV